METSLNIQIYKFIIDHRLLKNDDRVKRLIFSKKIMDLKGCVNDSFNPLFFEILMRDEYFLDYDGLKECLIDLGLLDEFELLIGYKFESKPWPDDNYSLKDFK